MIDSPIYLYVVCNKYSTLSYYNYVDILLVDNNQIYDIYKNKITCYNNYQIGVILDKDKLIPISTSLILYPSATQMYSIPIYKRKCIYPKNNKPYFRINKLNHDKNDFNIKPIILKVKVDAIQHSKNGSTGFIDLVMGDNYNIKLN